MQYWLITNHLSQISFHEPPPIIFLYKIYSRNRLLRVSFIKL